MKTFDFQVKIEAQNQDEAREVLTAMFDILKTVRSETSTKDFISFAKSLKAKPALVGKAKLFMKW